MTHDELAYKVAQAGGSWRTRSASAISGKRVIRTWWPSLSKALAQLQQQLSDLTSQRNSGDV